jgi:hypothetical protein
MVVIVSYRLPRSSLTSAWLDSHSGPAIDARQGFKPTFSRSSGDQSGQMVIKLTRS